MPPGKRSLSAALWRFKCSFISDTTSSIKWGHGKKDSNLSDLGMMARNYAESYADLASYESVLAVATALSGSWK